MNVLGVDVGGTRTKVAVVAPDGTVVRAATVPTPRDLAAPGAAARLVAGLAHDAGEVAACGVVVPGIVDDVHGVARWSANLGWRDLPLRDEVTAAVGLPVAVGHDVRAGLVAEVRWGAAVGETDVLFVPLGTGIAGAVMVDGHLLVADGYAGELGHVVVRPDGRECGCGARGCLETVASAAAVGRAYAERTGRPASAADVAERLVTGDPAAVAVWAEAVEALADGLALTVTLTGVRLVLVGGGLAESGDRLLEPLRTAIARRLTFQRVPRLCRPTLGDRAGALGAAALALDLLGS